ncbi:acyl-CoA synthetase short-chain family member 3, mitochondrial-like [Mizuhopecten yessoensis]|nr:acyl-CoA synthetase short-chain family member 3, mitochondrial-like [Mizuhopecten yessoensis]
MAFCRISTFSRKFAASANIRLIPTNCRHRLSCSCRRHARQFSVSVTDPNPKSTYERVFTSSIESPQDFWAEVAEDLVWHKKWDRVLDNSKEPFTKWFVGGEMNTCYNALDRHVRNGDGGHVAIIYDSPVTNTLMKYTYAELLDEVSRFAAVLRSHGVGKGDRVLIYLPMIPQAIISMLATIRIGAIHSLVFGGFAANELGVRIKHAKPKVIVSANCGVEPNRTVDYKPMLDNALANIDFKPDRCIIYNRPGFTPSTLVAGRDVCYHEEMAGASPVDCVPVSATDPSYILYTSGTTGLPKAVVRPSAGHAVVLKWSMWNIYGLKPKEVWWAASDLGWVVGHSYIAYAPLLNCNTTILFEGKPVGTPDPGTFFRVLKEHDVSAMFVAPTALRAIRREDPKADYGQKYFPLSKFQNMFVAGEHCDRETMEWTKNTFNVPVLDNWWQTETGWAITSTNIGLGNRTNPPQGVTGMPVPGWNVKVIRQDGSKTDPMELGQIVVKLPLPPGSFSTLWKNEEKFEETYFKCIPGYYNTMDSGYRCEEGYISVLTRTDDVINVAGHRLSTGALEEAILESEDVVEAAVVGVPDDLKGQIPLGVCVMKHGVKKSEEEVIQGVVNKVRQLIGPVASFKQAVIVPRLPKTRAGKTARNTLAAIAAGKPYKIPVTIEDATVYPAIHKALTDAGFPPK